MEEPLNLVKLTELMQIERRSRAPIARRTDIHAEVESAIGSGDIPMEDATRARQIVRDILFLRKRKIMLLAVDVFNGGRPELKGLTGDEKDLLSKAVALLRENDPFNDAAPSGKDTAADPPAEASGPAGTGALETAVTHARPGPAGNGPAAEAGPPAEPGRAAREGPPQPVVPGPAEEERPPIPAHPGPSVEDNPPPAEEPGPGHVILRALEKIDFVSLERTYLVDVDDVFTVDSGTADILARAGKAVRVVSGDD